MIGIEVRTQKLETALYRLAQAGRVDYGQVIKQEAKYVLQTIIAFTPPPNRRTGTDDVAGDMSRLSTPMSYEYFESRITTGGFYRSISRYIRKRETEKLQKLFNIPQLTGFYGKTMLGSVKELDQVHRQNRSNFGRINSKLPYATYAADYKKFLKDVQARVGWTLSGWVPAAKACGAKYKKWTEKLPKRTLGGSQTAGVVYANFGQNPFIVARNLNVKMPNYPAKVRSALQSRINITRRKLERVLAGKAVNLGFVRVKGGMPVSETT